MKGYPFKNVNDKLKGVQIVLDSLFFCIINYYPTVTELERTRSAWQFHLFCDPAIKTNEVQTSISQYSAETKDIRVFPNPVKDKAVLTLPDQDYFTLYILDLQGKMISQIKNIKGHTVEVNCVNLGSGQYLYNLINQKNGKTYSGKFIISKCTNIMLYFEST